MQVVNSFRLSLMVLFTYLGNLSHSRAQHESVQWTFIEGSKGGRERGRKGGRRKGRREGGKEGGKEGGRKERRWGEQKGLGEEGRDKGGGREKVSQLVSWLQK